MGLSVVQWVGGKGQQLEQLLPLIPYGRCFVDAYGGGGTVLMNRRRSEVEVYNDLNADVVSLFRVMQDPELFEYFNARLEATMWSKDEFRKALALQQSARRGDATVSIVDRAWALYVIQNQGISGSHSKSEGNWSRSLVDSKNTEKWWKRYPKLREAHERFRYVQIDSQEAVDCLRYWDSADTVHYVDPPYVLDTRGDRAYYEYEMEVADHEVLVQNLLCLEGMVVLSGYDHPVYEPLVDAGWTVASYAAHAYAKIVAADRGEAKPKRVEVVWRNPACIRHSSQLVLPF